MGAHDSHASLMDAVYRRQRHIYDLTRKYYLFGRDRLIDELSPRAGARIVEVGCGTARNLIRMARLYPRSRLFGLDASQAMLETARQAVDRAGLSARITLAHGYAEALSPELFGEPFDDIVFSYSLSMIPDWTLALDAAQRSLAPGGRIHIVDFGDLAAMPGLVRAGLLAWLRLFHVVPRAQLLQALERAAGRCDSFSLLPGRYAFRLTCRGGGFPDLS